jgi:hypothetical protein
MKNYSCIAMIAAVWMSAASAAFPAGPAYRVIFNMPAQYQQPNRVIEGSPGMFYVAAGTAIISVTTQGTMTPLASFPSLLTRSSLTRAPRPQMAGCIPRWSLPVAPRTYSR